MMLIRIAGALSGLALMATAGPVAAQSVPKVPPAGRIYGYVYVDDGLPDYGTQIYAYVGSTLCGQSSYDPSPYGGRYFVDLDSSLSDCSQAGEQVDFVVGSCAADASGSVPAFSGAQRVDISAPSTC